MNDFGSKIYDAAKKAVKEVYDLEPAEGQLIIETPRTPSWAIIPPALP
ncbi:MAG: hypothetical protein V8S87_08395 [Oscillospiraceae bacterium]